MGIKKKSQAKQKIGKTIQRLIKERGIVIEQMARDCEISKSTIYAIIRGDADSLTTLLKVCEYLNLNIEVNTK